MNRLHLTAAAVAAMLAACATPSEPLGPLAKETVHALTTDQRLVTFNAGQPQKLLASKAIGGLQPQETLLGIDYRVARGQLYALGSSGRLYRVDPASGQATAIGAPIAVPLAGREFGFDFNPAVDRIRVVGDGGQNLRLHPDTGAVVDADPKADGTQIDGTLGYDAADRNAGKPAAIVAAGYTYSKADEKVTTNFAIDAQQGTLVTQGSREGVQPAVSPNSGRLFTVGALGAGAFERAAFDIGDVDNTAYAALSGGSGSVLYRIDLATGAATRIGTVGGGQPVLGLAIVP